MSTSPTEQRSPCEIILTRPAGEAQAMAEAIEALGARVSSAPVIEFISFIEDNLERIGEILRELHARGGWLVLPSPTAIKHFSEVIARIEVSPALLDGLHVATIGQASAMALRQAGIPLDFFPEQPRAAALAAGLPLAAPGIPVLIVGSAQTRPEMMETLERRGARVQVLPLYAPEPNLAGLRILRAILNSPQPGMQVICVTSPSAVDAIAQEFSLSRSRSAPEFIAKGWVTIGPTTTRQLRSHGIAAERIEEASEPTAERIVAAAEILTRRLARNAPRGC